MSQCWRFGEHWVVAVVGRHEVLRGLGCGGRSSQCWRFGEHWVVAVVGRHEVRRGLGCGGRSSQCWRFGEHWVVAVVGRHEVRRGRLERRLEQSWGECGSSEDCNTHAMLCCLVGQEISSPSLPCVPKSCRGPVGPRPAAGPLLAPAWTGWTDTQPRRRLSCIELKGDRTDPGKETLLLALRRATTGRATAHPLGLRECRRLSGRLCLRLSGRLRLRLSGRLRRLRLRPLKIVRPRPPPTAPQPSACARPRFCR